MAILTQILNRFSGAVIFEAEVEGESYGLRLGLAVKLMWESRANLCEANLCEADLRGADLRGAYLCRANLCRADLCKADLRGAYLCRANLCGADLREADLCKADLCGANLCGADLCEADLCKADLRGAYLSEADLREADLREADLCKADLRGADLCGANLCGADLCKANLCGADLRGANLCKADLCKADLREADLREAKNMIKTMGVQPGNFYWKRFNNGLKNYGYQFTVGLNVLREGEVFAFDERQICSYPGFHFASRSWCAVNYPERPLESKIRIPEDAQINEPWATDGKASADKIEILQVFDVKSGKDVTDDYR